MPARGEVIRAAGTVLWRPGRAGPEVAVVHRSRYADWSLPKGKLERGETLPACAVRETLEETGFRPVLGRRLPEVRYLAGGAAKAVHYFTGKAAKGEFTPNDEVDELRWLTSEAAARLLSYAGDRLRELVRPGPAVVCSQGKAIPGLVEQLAARSGLPVGAAPLPAKKASVWVLSFAPAAPYELLAADYLPTQLPVPATV